VDSDQTMTRRETARLWLDLEVDGELPAAEAAGLEAALAELPELASERRELARLHQDLAAGRIAVREGFSDEVMRRLPAAAWEPVGRQRWSVAVVAASVLVVLSGLLLSLGGGAPIASGVGVLGALGGFFRATALAGAGLLGASWRGLGLALQVALESSPGTIALFGAGVVALNVLFLRLLRRGRRRPALERAAGRSPSGDPGA
jgi:anti-sigma factor RsiW